MNLKYFKYLYLLIIIPYCFSIYNGITTNNSSAVSGYLCAAINAIVIFFLLKKLEDYLL